MPILYNRKKDIFPPDAVYVGRPTKWGNPFKTSVTGSREVSISSFEEYLSTRPDLISDAMTELRGKDLVCHCSPKRCHADILLAIANMEIPGKRTIVAGSRSCNDYKSVKTAIESCGWDISSIVSGAAKGVDLLGERYARENAYRIERYPADWSKHGRRAGFMRNEIMGNNADALVAIWDGISSGTRHMIEYAQSKGLLTYVYYI